MVFSAFAILVCSLGIPARDAGEPTLRPPFRVQWEMNSRFDRAFFTDGGKQLVLFDGQRIVSVDVKTGKKKWARVFEKARGVLTYDEDRHEISLTAPFVSSYSGYEHERLSTINGSFRSYPFNKPCICIWQNLMTFRERSQPAQAIDMKTGKAVWSLQSLPAEADYWLSSIGDRLFVRMKPKGLYCFDFRDGKELWRNLATEVSPTQPFGSYLVCKGDNRTAILDSRTGSELWSIPALVSIGFSRYLVRFVSSNDDLITAIAYATDLVGYELKTGRVKWKAHLSDTPLTALTALDYQGGTLVLNSNELSFYTGEGRLVWTYALGVYDDYLLCGNSDGFVVNTQRGVAYYRSGKPADLPKRSDDRKKMTEELLSRNESLSEAENSLFLRLGEATFDAIESRISEALADSKYRGISDFDKLLAIAQKVVKPHHTARLVKLYERAQSRKSPPKYQRFLLKVLESCGDCNLATPVFVGELSEEEQRSPYSQVAEVALDGLIKSTDPTAVDMLIRLLKTSDVSAYIRSQCFGNLFKSGNIAALQAIQKEQITVRSLPSLSERLKLDQISMTGDHPQEKGYWHPVLTDREGVRWMLLARELLGDSHDRFVARWNGNRWDDLHYVEISTDDLYLPDKESTSAKSSGHFPPSVINPAWVDSHRQALMANNDSDKDGLADVIEARFGTDPLKADSDGDGLIDSVDLNPTTKRLPTTDTEKCLAAAFEAVVKYSGNQSPIIIEWPQGVEPFELSGCRGAILDQHKVGGYFTSSPYPDERRFLSFVGSGPLDIVDWSPDKLTAHIKIWSHSRYQNGKLTRCDLQKVQSKWIVSRMRSDSPAFRFRD